MARKQDKNWMDLLDDWDDGSSVHNDLISSGNGDRSQKPSAEEDWDDDPFLKQDQTISGRKPSAWNIALCVLLAMILIGLVIWLVFRKPVPDEPKDRSTPLITENAETTLPPVATEAPFTEAPVTKEVTATPSHRPTDTPTPSPTPTPAITPTPTPAYETLGSEWYNPNLRYYYFQLTDRERALFMVLYSGISDFQTSIQMGGYYSDSEINRVFGALQKDCPELFQVRFSYTIMGSTIQPEYRLTRPEYEDRSRIILGIIRTLREEAGSERDDFVREFLVYRYIATHCTYRILEGKTETADSCLVDGEAQCSGYARALSLVLRAVGIQCFDVHSETHEWTIVKINGEWYQCDATWDSRERGSVPDLDSPSGGGFFYLNVPDRLMTNQSHVQLNEEGFTVPVCSSMTDNYVIREGIYLGADVRDYSGELGRRIAEAEGQGARSFIIMLDDETAFRNYETVITGAGIQHSFMYSSSTDKETRTFYVEFQD